MTKRSAVVQKRPLPWERGKVPTGFWNDLENRRRYMRWLGRVLGFEKMQDWYRIKKQDFHAHSGGGLIANYYRDSPQLAVLECFPKFQWKQWLFHSTPQRYWQDPVNRLEYLEWLGKKLGYKKDSDWYKISRADFHTNSGGGLLANYYGDSVFNALREFRPKMDWLPWMFRTVPQGYWKSDDNRKIYLKWLGKQLGFRKYDDWYRLTKDDITRHHGEGVFIMYYRGSRMEVLKDLKPNHKWDPVRLRRFGRD